MLTRKNLTEDKRALESFKIAWVSLLKFKRNSYNGGTARYHERIWQSVDKRACWEHEGISLLQHCAQTRKNLIERRQTRMLEFDRIQPKKHSRTLKNIFAHSLARRTGFRKIFFILIFLRCRIGTIVSETISIFWKIRSVVAAEAWAPRVPI